MSIHQFRLSITVALTLASILVIASPAIARDHRWGRHHRDRVDAAVIRSVAAVEEGERKVDEVETVNRSGEGWRITGHMRGGEAFSCAVGSDGEITDSDVGDVVV